MSTPHVDVCICTFKRPEMLKRLLEAVRVQETGGTLTFSIVVADNDAARSAEPVVARFRQESGINITYSHEPRQNIALARNKTLENANGDYIAFIDDDEFPATVWLRELVGACERYKASGVLGPVRPHFDTPPPNWVIRGRFCERPEPPTGTVIEWTKSRTGNVLFRRSILNGNREPFLPRFGTGGEDQDFFRRMMEAGCTFVWCNEAPAYETVPPERWTRGYMLRRAMLRGANALKHPKGRAKLVAKSVIAVPTYVLILPVAVCLGHHVFMRYCIPLCDHAGRLLALFGANPVKER